MKPAFVFCAVVFRAAPVLAYESAASCDAAALAAAETHGIPPQVMLAITRVETGRLQDGKVRPWPWAINLAGSSHWFDTPQEAAESVRSAIEAGHSNIDIGCFQLNFRWHGEKFPSVEAMFDPQQNADYAARFLLENHQQKGNWVDAVAAYHSTTPFHAEAYINKIERVLAQLSEAAPTFMPEALPEPTSPQPRRNNQYPLLQPGSGATLASLVPMGGSVGALFSVTP